MSSATLIHPRRNLLVAIAALAVGAAITWTFFQSGWGAGDAPETRAFLPRKYTDTSGFALIVNGVKRWPPTASLAEIADCWRNAAQEQVAAADETLASLPEFDRVLIPAYLHKASALNYQSQPRQAYAVLQELRRRLEPHPHFAEEWLYSVVYFQGITALRIGEDDNCILCRGESSCILPISSAAVHTQPEGSRLAIRHFTEYLQQFPDDRDVRWLLNLAHLTLGEHPGNVDPRFLVPLDRFAKSELDIGKFRDIGHVVGVNRFNQGGGGIMDDFDNDGLLDIVVSSIDPLQPMGLYRNRGDGTFEDRTDAAGLSNQLGGLYCVQADYDNDGWLDLFVPRGAWLDTPMRPSLLRNNGDGKFKDVTQAAGILHPANSISAAWVDYDNDGFLDLFVCSDIGANLLFRNQGDGTFEEVAARAGLQGSGMNCKGSAWLDFDRDDWTDVFLNYRNGPPQLFRNRGDGTFQDVTESMGIRGPLLGFSCWAFDYDNDGWLDIFATSYDRTLGDAIEGLLGNPHSCHGSVLYRNKEGKRFENVTKRVGLDMVFVTMGSNYGDFDNDGFLDFYLGTGDPNLGMLVPNRMLKNRPPAERPRRRRRRLGPKRQRRHLHPDGRRQRRRQIPQHPLPEPRPGKQLAHAEAHRHKDQPLGHRGPHQGGDGRERTAHHLSSRFNRKQLWRQPAATDHRAGQGGEHRPGGDSLAGERHNASLPRGRAEPGHRGDGVRQGLSPARVATGPAARGKIVAVDFGVTRRR
jgi:hypothetical protein